MELRFKSLEPFDTGVVCTVGLHYVYSCYTPVNCSSSGEESADAFHVACTVLYCTSYNVFFAVPWRWASVASKEVILPETMFLRKKTSHGIAPLQCIFRTFSVQRLCQNLPLSSARQVQLAQLETLQAAVNITHCGKWDCLSSAALHP